jgi:hypothetical protein
VIPIPISRGSVTTSSPRAENSTKKSFFGRGDSGRGGPSVAVLYMRNQLINDPEIEPCIKHHDILTWFHQTPVSSIQMSLREQRQFPNLGAGTYIRRACGARFTTQNRIILFTDSTHEKPERWGQGELEEGKPADDRMILKPCGGRTYTEHSLFSYSLIQQAGAGGGCRQQSPASA